MRWKHVNRLALILFVLLILLTYYAGVDNPEVNGYIQEIKRFKEEESMPVEGPPVYTALGWVNYEKLEQDVYEPLGLVMDDKVSLIPKLSFRIQPNCETVGKLIKFRNLPDSSKNNFWLLVSAKWQRDVTHFSKSAEPPKKIPKAMEKNFTLNEYMHFKTDYGDDRSGVRSIKWNMVKNLMKQPIGFFKKREANQRLSGVAMFYAMKFYGLKRMQGVTIGSSTPWVEAFALKNGATKVTAIDYTNLEIIGTAKVVYLDPASLLKSPKKYYGTFDFAASYSSMEHVGLGRFGDAIDPFGDVQEILKLRCLLKEGGLLFLGIPIGPDSLNWNLQRIYGRIRLGIMFTGFQVLSVFENDNNYPIGIADDDFGPESNVFSSLRQPVFVLKKLSRK